MTYQDLPRNLLDFGATLRVQGFSVGPEETRQALAALEAVDIGDYAQVKNALQLVLCASREQEELFDALFRAHFLPTPAKQAPPESQSKASEGGRDEQERAPQQRKGKGQPSPGEAAGGPEPTPTTPSEDDSSEGGAPLSLQALFSPFQQRHEEALEPPPDAEEMRAAAAALLKRVRLGRSRRWRSVTRGPRFHFRRTLRRSLQTGGEALVPAWLGHPPRKPRFVLLLDGSRSMASYSGRLLQFALALSQRSARVEVFVFSTSLKRITRSLRRRRSLSDLGDAWGGGTQIGECLSDFVRRYGTGLLTRDTLVLIASDGLDAGDAERLGRAARDLHRLSAGVVWLNPLLNTPGYEPTAAGMQAALPYIDTFTSADDVASFERLSSQVRLR